MSVAEFVYRPGPVFDPAPFRKVVAADPSRITNKLDPLDSGKWTTRFECRPTDVTPDHCRAELIDWQRLDAGMTWWLAWSWLFRSGVERFIAPNEWATLGQVHWSEAPGQQPGSPLCQLVARAYPDGDRLLWVVRPHPELSRGGPEIDFGRVPRGVRLYFLAEVGPMTRLWMSSRPVGPASVPRASVPVEFPPGWWAFGPQLGIYRNPGGNPATIAYSYGLAKAGTAARAMQLAGWTP